MSQILPFKKECLPRSETLLKVQSKIISFKFYVANNVGGRHSLGGISREPFSLQREFIRLGSIRTNFLLRITFYGIRES